mgnify:CR=1 FL=1
MDYRMERDSMGEMEVHADRYWGAQTQRSYQNFQIGTEKMPEEIVRAFGILKKAAALANHRLGKLVDERLGLISRACDEVVAGKLDGHFPLVVWQTGSGTQSNMNVNEVVANRGNELAGKKLLAVAEDAFGAGCVGQRTAAILAQHGQAPEKLVLINLGKTFLPEGTVPQLEHQAGIDAAGIARAVQEART